MITLYYYTTKTFDQLKRPTSLVGFELADISLLKPRAAVAAVNPSRPLSYVNNDLIASQVFKTKVSLTIQEDDDSYRLRRIMTKPQLVLKFSLPEYIEIPVGAWCEFQGQIYSLNYPQNFKKNGERNIEYTLTMGSREDELGDYKLRNLVDRRLKFSLCMKPEEFLAVIVGNLNERDGEGVWKVGKYPSASEKTIEFNHSYIDEGLKSVADVFETEYEITEDFTINLGRVEYKKDDPLPLSYGKGNGFVPGLGRTATAEERPIKRLYVQGGERNIDRSTYGSAELLLPKGQTLRFDGSHFEGEEGFNDSLARTYKSDDLGYYIERSDKSSEAVKEDSLDCSESYPSRVGYVSEFREVDKDKNFYNLIDLTLPTEEQKNLPTYLNFNDAQIAGETMTLIFQSGMLAGREFEFIYIPKDRRFEIKPQEYDGIMMPNETFKAKVGDSYAVFGISLPQAYINAYDPENPTTTKKEGAEWDMFKEAVKFLYDHELQKFTFSGEIQALWAKRNWLKIGAYLKVGAYILFTDPQFCPDGEPIRVIGIKDWLSNPHAPTLELSNGVASASSSVSSQLRQIDETEVIIDDTKKSLIQFTKRRFRDALETATMLAEANLKNFAEGITPITVQTMSALIGDESLQFRFVGKQGEGDNIQWVERFDIIGYDNESHKLTANMESAGMQIYLQHMTLGIKRVSSHLDYTDMKTWKMKSFESPNLASEQDMSKGYFFYARCSKSDFDDGSFVLSEKAIELEQETGYYHFLVGILTSMQEGERSYTSLYGFTEILPGRITTDIIISADGKTYFNLATGEICGNIKFLGDNDEYFTLIEGGKIKTEFIDVSKLVAHEVIVGEEGKQRVEIRPSSEGNGSVKIFDEEDNEVSVFEGQSYSGISQLYNPDTGGTIPMLSRTAQSWGYASGVTWGRGKATYNAGSVSLGGNNAADTIIVSGVWHTPAPTQVTIDSGHLYAYAYATGYSVQNSGSNNGGSLGLGGTQIINPTPVDPVEQSQASAYIAFYVETYSDEALTNRINTTQIGGASTSASASARDPEYTDGNSTYFHPDSNSSTIKLAKKKYKIPAGYHRLKINFSCSASRSGSTATVSWGAAQSGHDDITASFKNDSYVSRFFANGFCLGTRSDNYIMAFRDSNGMRFIMENNDLGFDFSKDGIKTRAKGKGWMPLPLLIYKASYYYLSTDDNYHINNQHGYKSFNGITLSAQKTSKGLVTLTFPSQWINDLGTISVENLLVQVNAHHKVIDARIEQITTSAIKVAMSDDASLNDGDFGIVVYFLPS